MTKLIFPHELAKAKLLKYELKVKLSPLTLFLKAAKLNQVKLTDAPLGALTQSEELKELKVG